LKNGQKLKLGDAKSPQEISKKYKRQSLGMPPRHPFFIDKNQVTFQCPIFLLLHALCVFLGASVVFIFQFCLVLFDAINGWTPTNEVALLFICQEHSVFHSIRFHECSLFLELCLAFDFCLNMCSDLVISFYQGIFFPLVHIGFHQKSCLKKFEWCQKREKALCKKVVQEGACVDCGLGFCMSCLMSF
jgi:hypothetical protein